jgi:hypothetical protein|eukprot:COSAG06_NODE_198_length_20467_cov_97.440986_10_plen_46_part_00
MNRQESNQEPPAIHPQQGTSWQRKAKLVHSEAGTLTWVLDLLDVC